ncbi:hypothetical protein [Rurimicrobium arvi]
MPLPSRLMKRLPNLLLLLSGVVLSAGCMLYLVTDRSKLLQWYDSKGSCYYRMKSPAFEVLSADVKRQGNIICIATLLMLPVFFLLLRRCPAASWHKTIQSFLQIVRRNLLLFTGVTLALLLPQLYWLCAEAFATDEVFSALNFSGQPLLYTLTQYPLPNNHIGFNLFAHLIPGSLTQRIYGARVLAMLFYLVHAWLLLGVLLLHLKDRSLAFWSTLIGMMVFMVAGFGHQARGYSLLFLLGFAATYSLYRIYATGKQEDKGIWYGILAVSNVAGMFVAPSFLYITGFEVLYILAGAVLYRRFPRALLYSLCLSAIGSALVYVPVMCVSGVQALTGNKYVKPDEALRSHLWENMPGHLGVYAFEHSISLPTFTLCILFSVSALLCGIWLLYTKALKGSLLLLPACHLLSVILLSWLLGHLPYGRILGLQMQLLTLSCFICIGIAIGKIERNRFSGFLSALCSVAVLWGMFLFYGRWADTRLYDQDTNRHKQVITERARQFPPNSQVWLSEESFMWMAYGNSRINTAYLPCHFSGQSYLVFSDNEDLQPKPEFIAQYRPLDTAGDYRIWVRKIVR